MVTVVSMSPAIDKRIRLGRLHVGETNRALDVFAEGAGKAVDVSLALAALSVEVRCTGILPGGGAPITERLSRFSVTHAFMEAPGMVRTNLKLVDTQTGVITEINEPVAAAPGTVLLEAAQTAAALAKESRFLVLSGSLPEGCGADFYAKVIAAARTEAPVCRVVLDADGERLLHALPERPFLVKPNLKELEGAMGRRLTTQAEVLFAADSLISRGAKLAAVSMGAEGAMLVGRAAAFFAPALPVDVVTTTGAGDAMVAGLICGLETGGGDLSEALRCGVAAAAARCAFGGDRFLNPALFERLAGEARVQRIR